jgi:hypothetical protein
VVVAWCSPLLVRRFYPALVGTQKYLNDAREVRKVGVRCLGQVDGSKAVSSVWSS